MIMTNEEFKERIRKGNQMIALATIMIRESKELIEYLRKPDDLACRGTNMGDESDEQKRP